MKWKVALAALLVIAAVAPISHSQEPTDAKPKTSTAKPAVDKSSQAEVDDGLQNSPQAFADAFNRRDAKSVAALWTANGEYVDEQGERFEGRGAIEKQYAKFFAAHPKAKIAVRVDSLRLVSDGAAIEDGHATLTTGPLENATAKYTAVHVKVEGQWLTSSVRETSVSASAEGDRLTDLDWLIGKWSAEERGAKMEVNCRWIADKKFLERSYSVMRAKKVLSSGVQIVGWNSELKTIQSWTFSSDGGHAVGVWSPAESGWSINSSGMLSDGTSTQAVNSFTRLDDNALTWKSTNRMVGAVQLPDAPELLLKRQDTAR